MNKETNQIHPRYYADRRIVNELLTEKPNDYNLTELARLIICYRGFPGALDIQSDLKVLLTQWNHTEASLFDVTRLIHAKGEVYRGSRGHYDYLQQKQVYPGDELSEVV
jgi:hypothetical protein